MTKEAFLRATVFRLAESVKYSDGGVTSKQILKTGAGNITLFSFDRDQGLSEHTAPFDALVQVLDGEAEFTIGGKPLRLEKGDSVMLPSGIPHAVQAVTRFKMLLTMIRE